MICDEATNRSTFAKHAKHGLEFTDAKHVLTGRGVMFLDDRFDCGEERLIALGLLAG